MDDNESTLRIGQVLKDRYRIVGEGRPEDIGIVYEAKDLRYERMVAVLVLAPRYAGDWDALRRLWDTQQAVIDLAIPELVPVEDAGLLGEQLYLVRSQVEGYTLAGLEGRLGRLSFDVAVRIAMNLCDALSPLHRAGLVHGSLSPYSVLVQDSGAVLVTEVGLFPALYPVSSAPGQPWGRVPYLTPEQAAGERVLPSSDVYVIGSLLYEMLAGRAPFQGHDDAVLAVRHLRHDPPSLHVLVPDIPPQLVDIVQKCMAKEPAARYRNAGQMASILRFRIGPGEAGPIFPRPVTSTRRVSPGLPAAPRPARQRLVVPPPPAAADYGAGSVADAVAGYPPGEGPDDWIEEPAAVDWILVALVVVALAAVLGLIPLWRTVYRRYAAPPPALYRPSMEDHVCLAPRVGGLANGTNIDSKLDDSGLVWYNFAVANRPIPWTASVAVAGTGGYRLVWESRLRRLGVICDIL